MAPVLTTLVSFNSTNGANPNGGLIADANGDLFGTTQNGGANGDGTVFELVNNNGTYTLSTLVTFTGSNGANPVAGLSADANGDLFGTTERGGTLSDGTAYELVNNNGTYNFNAVFNFDTFSPIVGLPVGGVIADANGNLFGTDVYAGGTAFELVNNNGTYAPKLLAVFFGPDGLNPQASLIADASGDLFGTTTFDGANGVGTVFELVNNNGNLQQASFTPNTLVSFDGSNGASPSIGSSLIADANGDLFGTTQGDGVNNQGTVFELVNNNNGTYTPSTLFAFSGSNGAGPVGGLIADANGDLFGATAGGGANGDGTVFELVNNNGSYALITLLSFDGSNGSDPTGTLIEDANGDLFGTTAGGGANGDGTVFEIKTVTHWTNTLGGNWSAATNWNPGVPTTTLNADIDATGTYSVAITTAAIAYGLLVNDAKATVSDNKGSLVLAGSGGAANPNGSLTIDAGTFVLNGGGLNAGTIFIGSGSTLQIAKGTYTIANALSEAITDNGSLIDDTSATITGNVSGTGTILAEKQANLTINGSLTGSENFTLTNSAHVFISTNVSGTGSFTIANSAVLEFGAGDTEPIAFASASTGTVKFDQSLTQPTGTISGLTPKTKIDLADLPFTKGKMTVVPSLTATGDTTLTVTNQSTNQSVSLNLAGNLTNAKWVLSKDANGGTIVVDPPAPTSTNNGSPGLEHVVALFNQFMAAGFPEQHGGQITTNALSQVTTNEQQFLANPHHG